MSSRASIAVTVSVVTLAIGGWAPAAGAKTVAEGTVDLVECTRGKRAADRNAVFRGEMRHFPDASSMRMRYALSERIGRDVWQSLRAPGLGVWRYARPGVSTFAYRQRIAALQPGTAYRVDVTFQWHDAAGRLIERQVARSPVCRQGGDLPDVRVSSLAKLPGPTPDTVRYIVSVANKGRVSVKKVAVSLLVDGAEVDTRGMGDIPARGRREIAFVGPACTAEVVVELDPSRKLRELDKSDNTRSFPCSTPG